MDKNSIILQDITPEQLLDLISNGIKNEFEGIKGHYLSPDPDVLLTRDEACRFLKVNSSTLWTWTNKGKVKAYGIGSRVYYKKSELLEALTLKK